MEKKNATICPFCKCHDAWYIHASGEEQVYQCTECNRYFKVQAGESAKAENRARVTGS